MSLSTGTFLQSGALGRKLTHSDLPRWLSHNVPTNFPKSYGGHAHNQLGGYGAREVQGRESRMDGTINVSTRGE